MNHKDKRMLSNYADAPLLEVDLDVGNVPLTWAAKGFRQRQRVSGRTRLPNNLGLGSSTRSNQHNSQASSVVRLRNLKAQRTWRQAAAKLLMEFSTDAPSNPYPGEEQSVADRPHGGHWQMASDFLPGIAMPPPGSGASKYRGVSWHKRNRKWRATCRDRIAKKSLHLGYFSNEEAAARVYDKEAIRIRGPSTRLNFKASDYGVKADPCGADWLQQRRNCTYLGAGQCGNASKAGIGKKTTRKRKPSKSVPAASMPVSWKKSKKGRTTNAACSTALLNLAIEDNIAPTAPKGPTTDSEAPNRPNSRTRTTEIGCALGHAKCPDQPLGCTTPTKRRTCCKGLVQGRALF